MDPIVDNEETRSLKAMVVEVVQDIDSALTIHDFRVVTGVTHTNLIFDLVMPFDYSTTEEKLREMVDAAVKERRSDCFTVIQIDRSYIS